MSDTTLTTLFRNSQTFEAELVRRNNDGTVVVLDPLGIEWKAESIVVYKLIEPIKESQNADHHSHS